jgi:CubicO group peptidase (beta-lactamase class C family)
MHSFHTYSLEYSSPQTAVSVNIVYGDKILWEGGFGVMNKSEKIPKAPTSKTVYPCASISKVLTVRYL